MKKIGRMKSGHERNAAVGLPRATEACDGDLLFQQSFHGGFAQSHNELGLDEIDLPMKPGRTGGHLLAGGRAVAGA